jgi:outer membrane autotransporter protein
MLVPELRGRWQHEFLDSRGSIDAQFAGQPASGFTADGVKTPADSAVVGAGVLIRFSDAFSAFVDYDAKFNRREMVHNVTGGLRLTW